MRFTTILSQFITLSALAIVSAKEPGDRVYQRGFLSKEKAHESIEVQGGYSLELVLSEPYVDEPVMVAWDGNGAMYVVEMSTYMQDADASGEKLAKSRITRHVDSNGDGSYDKHSVFAKDLVLPRFVLPLDNRVIVGVTDTLDLWTYEDTTGNGVADDVKKIYEGGRRGGNMEHQPSGLMWGLDNWMYLTYEAKRYRFTDGEFRIQDMQRGSGQWGLTQDDWGRIYYSTAGGETPASNFQQPLAYGPLKLPGEEEDGFRAVYPIAEVPDVQGGERRVGPNGGVNNFTGISGQSIFRGDRLPADLRGDLIIPEPVGRLIRRAKVDRKDAKSVLRNAYPGSEFIRTRDVNFRPVWSATTPGGQMMIVDMHRGIIQQGNWTKPGSYLRGVIDKWKLDRNTGKGRIYRLVHEDFKAGPQPRMLDESTRELVAHLSHPNGWWRDTAQKLIILREDHDSVVPALEEMVRSEESELGRLHALWTLEGIGNVGPDVLVTALGDDASIVRSSAVRIAEPFMAAGDESVIAALASRPTDDAEMAVQILNSLTASRASNPRLLDSGLEIERAFRHIDAVGAVMKSRADAEAAALNVEKQKLQGELFSKSVERGKAAYEQLCFACHGPDGQGTPMVGRPGAKLAPSFTGSPRVLGSGKSAVRVLLHGLTGPIDGRTYEGLMVPMANNDDQWIADVVTYVRNSFGNEAPMISQDLVAGLRKTHAGRAEAWTAEELEELEPQPLRYQRNWKLKASHNSRDLKHAFDEKTRTRYSTEESMRPGMWVQIGFPRKTMVSGLTLDTSPSKDDYPRGYSVQVSDDGRIWSAPVATGEGSKRFQIAIPAVETRYLRITQTGKNGLFWSIHEMEVTGKEL